MKILNELGKRISPPEYWHDDYEQFLEDVLRPAGLSFAEFVEIGYLKGPDRFNLHLVKGFRTPSGKVELKLSQAEKLKLKPLPEYTGLPEEEWAAYPLLLISAKSPHYLHSSYRWVQKLRQKSPRPEVQIHPDTVQAQGISTGDEVVISTPYGQITAAVVTDRVMQGVLCADIGWWFPREALKPNMSGKNQLQHTDFNKQAGQRIRYSNLKNILAGRFKTIPVIPYVNKAGN